MATLDEMVNQAWQEEQERMERVAKEQAHSLARELRRVVGDDLFAALEVGVHPSFLDGPEITFRFAKMVFQVIRSDIGGVLKLKSFQLNAWSEVASDRSSFLLALAHARNINEAEARP